ncbi:Uncharacterised protein [Shigella sonnei]|nr:Uncharacterised protein [Shigella sonnei]
MTTDKEVALLFLHNFQQCFRHFSAFNTQFCLRPLNIFRQFIQLVIRLILQQLKNIFCCREVDTRIQLA